MRAAVSVETSLTFSPPDMKSSARTRTRKAVEATRWLAALMAPALPADNFRTEPLEQMSFPDHLADVVLSSAVLHFARDDDHFDAMLRGTWRVLKPDGLLFCRLASSIGMEEWKAKSGASKEGASDCPTDRNAIWSTKTFLMALTEELGGKLVDPLKTTVVQNQRCMTTWVVRKSA